MTLAMKGSCHCGATHWTLKGDPGAATACNCTLFRRYGALWAYDYEGERIGISGAAASYAPKPRRDWKFYFAQSALACCVGAGSR